MRNVQKHHLWSIRSDTNIYAWESLSYTLFLNHLGYRRCWGLGGLQAACKRRARRRATRPPPRQKCRGPTHAHALRESRGDCGAGCDDAPRQRAANGWRPSGPARQQELEAAVPGRAGLRAGLRAAGPVRRQPALLGDRPAWPDDPLPSLCGPYPGIGMPPISAAP